MHLLCRPELRAAFRNGLACRRAGRLLRGSVVGLGLLAWANDARPQGPADGAIHGVVEDAGGSYGSGVKLTATGSTTSRATLTASDGTFLLPHLEPGEYVLAFEANGSSAGRSLALSVRLGETLEVRVRLERPGGGVAAASAQVGVVPGSSLADEALVEDDRATTLPDENNDGLTSSHGLAAIQGTSLMDGAAARQVYSSVPVGSGSDPAPDPDGDPDSAERSTGPANGLARGRHAGVAYVFSQAAVREFRVTGQSYTALSGRGGGVATTVSRGGTEDLHGSGFFVLRSQALAATNPLSIATSYNNGSISSAVVKPHDLRESFGTSLGGPIPDSHRLLFFDSLDLQRRGFPAISSPADPNFYNLTAMQAALLANRGVSSAQRNAALNYLSSLTGSSSRRADQELNFGRVDWRPQAQPTRIPALSVDYNLVRWSSPAGLVNAPVVARGRASLGSAAGSLDALLVRATSSVSAHVLNQARVSFLRDLQYESPQTPLAQEPAISPGGLAPEVNIGPNGLLFGTPAGLSQLAYPDERRVQLTDTVTYSRGHHSIDVGGEVSFVHDRVATQANAAGTFRYDSGVTKGFAGGLVDFITDYTFNVNAIPDGGCPAINATIHNFCFRSFTQSFGVTQTEFSTEDWAGFVEDTWRASRQLTVHAGARYEYTLLPLPATPNAALDAVFGARGATSVFPEDRNNLGPRVAVAWEPFGAGQLTVHAGYGFFFGRLPGATIRNALTRTGLPSSTTNIRITPTTVTACPQVAAQGFGYPCAFTSAPTGVVAATTSAVVFDRRFRLPAIQQASLSLERTVFRHTSVTAEYVLNLDRQLPSSTDLNIAPSIQRGTFQLQGGTGAAGVMDGETFQVPLYTTRVTPLFGPVTDVISNVNATYNGLAMSMVSTPAQGLLLRASYTWSKAIDFGQAQSAIPRTDGQFDPFTNGYDKSLSALNYPWAMHASAVWAPRVHSATGWVRRAANGWQLAPILIARAGRPYSLDISGGTRLPGGHESINGSGGALYLPTVGRNTLRLPATATVDLRAERGFRAGSRMQVHAGAEAFNLFNHRNISSVTQRAFLVGTAVNGITPLVFQSAAAIATEGLNTQAFGTPTAASTSLVRERQIQLSVRVQF